jgi:hypothetical protein
MQVRILLLSALAALAPALAAARAPAGRFTLVDADVAFDTKTRLTWQRGMSPGVFSSVAEATAYCADLQLGGHDDWRLPSAHEMASIVDSTRVKPAFDVTVFRRTIPYAASFATSTASAAGGGAAFVVWQSGIMAPVVLDAGSKLVSRCVR